jgi:hypothetical protein
MSRVDEVFQGTKGSITLGSGLIEDLEKKTVFEYPRKWGDDPNPYQVEHDRLFASIRNGGVIADAENAAKSTLTAIMGRMATYSGKKVGWEQALNANYQLVPENMTWDSTPPVMPDAEGYYAIPQPGKTTFE